MLNPQLSSQRSQTVLDMGTVSLCLSRHGALTEMQHDLLGAQRDTRVTMT